MEFVVDAALKTEFLKSDCAFIARLKKKAYKLGYSTQGIRQSHPVVWRTETEEIRDKNKTKKQNSASAEFSRGNCQ